MSRKTVIKLGLSAAMLGLVLYSADVGHLRAELASVSLGTVLFVALGFALSQSVSAFRWWIITRAAGISSSYRTALSACYIGMYLNCFGLGTLGGDIARALLITDDMKQRQTSLATVVADRSFGLAVLVFIGVIASFFFYSAKLNVNIIGAAAVFAVVIGMGWVFGPRLVHVLLGDTRWGSLTQRISAGFPSSPGTLLLLVVVTVLFHLFQISLFGVLATEVGRTIPFEYLLVSIPFANIVSTLPVSWMGLGVRENSYVFFFVPMFLTHEQAVLCGALWLLAMTTSGLVGGIIAVLTGDLKIIRKRSGEGVAAPAV